MPPTPSRPAVTIPLGVLAALVAAVVASVIAVAFFVGRESGRAQPSAPPPTFVTGTGPAVALPPVSTADAPAPTLPPIDVAPAAASPASAPAAAWPSVAPPVTAAGDTLREEVATYFRQVDAIQSQGKGSSDPDSMAKALLEQGANGDMSGFDNLARANQKIRDDLGALAVPEPCREHHRQTVALIQESIGMLQRIKDKIQAGDMASLAALPTEGYALQKKAKDVDALAVEIKRRFSL